jgi:hypothetical protein
MKPSNPDLPFFWHLMEREVAFDHLHLIEHNVPCARDRREALAIIDLAHPSTDFVAFN